VLAFDLDTGLINWARPLSPLDAWQLACGTIGGSVSRNETLCPFHPGPDADFGMAPTFVPASKNTPFGKDVVVIGQKNGVLHAISAQAGTHFWSTITSPDGSGGGVSWGIAVDDSQVYFTADNSGLLEWTPKSTSKQIKNSGFGAASLTDGSLVWEIAAPGDSISVVPPSVVNDVVLTGYTNVNSNGSGPGAMLVLDKMTGRIMKQYPLDQQYHGGITIQDSFIMFGTGYSNSTTYNGTGEFHVWSV
jgi:PQQ-like domain